MNKKLADSIIALRKKNGLSQEQLAEKIGISRQTVSNWERGIAAPDLETLNLISKLFDEDLSVMINGGNSGRGNVRGKTPYRSALLITDIVLMAVHFVLAFLDKIEMLHVVLGPGVLVALSVLIHFLFCHVVAQNDYSIIAGYDKRKDNTEIVKKQLETIDLLNLTVVLFFNILFFIMYTGPKVDQIIGSLVFLGAYVLMLIIIVVGVNIKINLIESSGMV